ncbi:MAG: ArnT family glycosyltransferase, partial [Chthoniobacterales bacterium]
MALFLVTRVGMLQRFPIFNDEAIYLQYSQFIHANWAKNKFISMNYTYGDWKPPLQYWMTAPFITWGDDPLIVGRAVAVLVSFAGLFGFYLFTRELFSKVEGAITAVLYALCPTVLFHNDQFVAETFLFSTAPFVYWTLLNALRGGRRTWAWMVAATLIGAALLLFKQSGSLLLLGAIALPLAQRPIAPGRARPSSVLRAFVIVALVMIGAEMIAALFQPAAYNATKARFNSNWVMSAPELVRFPIAVWRSNLQVVADYITSYYSWLVVAFVVAFVWLALRRKRLNELVLALLCLSSGASVCLLLRGFNEYIVNTAIIVTLLP